MMNKMKTIIFLVIISILLFSTANIFAQIAESIADEKTTEKYPESKHKYENNKSDIQSYNKEKATWLRITFDKKTEVQKRYDKIYIKNSKGKDIKGSPFTGKSLAGKTIEIQGGSFTIILKANRRINKWGYKITNIESDVAEKEAEEKLDLFIKKNSSNLFKPKIGLGLSGSQSFGEISNVLNFGFGGYLFANMDVPLPFLRSLKNINLFLRPEVYVGTMYFSAEYVSQTNTASDSSFTATYMVIPILIRVEAMFKLPFTNLFLIGKLGQGVNFVSLNKTFTKTGTNIQASAFEGTFNLGFGASYSLKKLEFSFLVDYFYSAEKTTTGHFSNFSLGVSYKFFKRYK